MNGLAAPSPDIRVSTAAQAASGLGLDAQRQAILEHTRANGLELAAWHEDAGRSGATMTRRSGPRLRSPRSTRAARAASSRQDRPARPLHRRRAWSRRARPAPRLAPRRPRRRARLDDAGRGARDGGPGDGRPLRVPAHLRAPTGEACRICGALDGPRGRQAASPEVAAPSPPFAPEGLSVRRYRRRTPATQGADRPGGSRWFLPVFFGPLRPADPARPRAGRASLRDRMTPMARGGIRRSSLEPERDVRAFARLCLGRGCLQSLQSSAGGGGCACATPGSRRTPRRPSARRSPRLRH